MPTKRDDAAYKRHYKAMRGILVDFDVSVVRRRIEIALHVWDEDYPEHEAAKMDAATDILMERGLCASVLNWHERPKPPRYAEDDLPW